MHVHMRSGTQRWPSQTQVNYLWTLIWHRRNKVFHDAGQKSNYQWLTFPGKLKIRKFYYTSIWNYFIFENEEYMTAQNFTGLGSSSCFPPTKEFYN